MSTPTTRQFVLRKIRWAFVCFSGLLIISACYLLGGGQVTLGLDWRTAERHSSDMAPNPQKFPEALIQVYSARAFSWRGLVGVHTWIAIKPANGSEYITLQVVGWRKWRGLPVVKIEPDLPDRLWYGAKPEIIAQLCGADAQEAIAQIFAAAKSYPYSDQYRIWPGPNSNTFISHINRRVPNLGLTLPATAIGKDYLTEEKFLFISKKHDQIQFSLFGLLGISLGPGIKGEINMLGAVFGASLDPLFIQLPFIGKIGGKQQFCQPQMML